MILVAESGSTKTDYCLFKDNKTIQYFHTQGINPYFQVEQEITSILKDKFPSDYKNWNISRIYFYGAGCSSEERCKKVSNALNNLFPAAKIKVQHDLLAAARALCGQDSGIACILGTGSNSCYFNGKHITTERGGIGFILGDEGSGSDMGKRLVRGFLYNELPTDLLNTFCLKYPDATSSIIENVYRNVNANRYLASFAPFIKEHISHQYLQELVYKSFDSFFTGHIIKYDNFTKERIHFVGSIAYHFANILKKVASNYDLTVGRIISKPIDQLVSYHIRNQETNE